MELNLLGYLLLVWPSASVCITGGSSRGGGVYGPLGTAVPLGCLPKGAGRPMGGAALPLRNPPRFFWFVVWVCVWFSDSASVSVCFFVSGRGDNVEECLPFKTRIVLAMMFVVFFWKLVVDVSLSLSLSLSLALSLSLSRSLSLSLSLALFQVLVKPKPQDFHFLLQNPQTPEVFQKGFRKGL